MIREILLGRFIRRNYCISTFNEKDAASHSISIAIEERTRKQNLHHYHERKSQNRNQTDNLLADWFFPAVHCTKDETTTYVRDVASIINSFHAQGINIPLLSAAIHTGVPRHDLQCILNTVKHCAFVRDGTTNRLPIHDAVAKGLDWYDDGLVDVVGANPRAVEEVDCVTLFPPCVLAAVHCDLNDIYELIRYHPVSLIL